MFNKSLFKTDNSFVHSADREFTLTKEHMYVNRRLQLRKDKVTSGQQVWWTKCIEVSKQPILQLQNNI